jgi:hypothetical protein
MRPYICAVTHRLGPGAAWFVCLPVRLRNYTGVFSLLTGRKVTRTGQARTGIERVPAHRSGHPSSWTAPPSVCASSSAASAPTTRSTRSDDPGLVIGGRTVTSRRPDVRRRTHGAPASHSACPYVLELFRRTVTHSVLEPASKNRRPLPTSRSHQEIPRSASRWSRTRSSSTLTPSSRMAWVRAGSQVAVTGLPRSGGPSSSAADW